MRSAQPGATTVRTTPNSRVDEGLAREGVVASLVLDVGRQVHEVNHLHTDGLLRYGLRIGQQAARRETGTDK